MAEKWLIQPGQTRVIDVAAEPRIKIGLVGGQVDVVAHDEPTVRIEVHDVTVKDLRIEVTDGLIEIDHPQLRWDNFLEVFRNFGSGGPKAEVSVAVPRDIALTLGVVSAGALVTGLVRDAKVNTVTGDMLVDGHDGNLTANAVSGEIQVRGLNGDFGANSVSGDVAVTGRLRKVLVDTVSGDVSIDGEGELYTVNANTVSGNVTVRLDEGRPANFVTRTVSGRVQIDGVLRSKSGPSNVTDSVGDLSGSFLDLNTNTVSGDITVLRRRVDTAAFPDAGSHARHDIPTGEPFRASEADTAVTDTSAGAGTDSAAGDDSPASTDGEVR